MTVMIMFLSFNVITVYINFNYYVMSVTVSCMSL